MDVLEKVRKEQAWERAQVTVPKMVVERYGPAVKIAGLSPVQEGHVCGVRAHLIRPNGQPLSLFIADKMIEEIHRDSDKGREYSASLRKRRMDEMQAIAAQATAQENLRQTIQSEYGDGYDSLFEERE